MAKVQKNELSEEKELFFYTKSRIYYTNLIILQKKQSKKFFVYAYHHISPFEGSPRTSAAEYVLGGMFVKGGMWVKGGMLQTDKLN